MVGDIPRWEAVRVLGRRAIERPAESVIQPGSVGRVRSSGIWLTSCWTSRRRQVLEVSGTGVRSDSCVFLRQMGGGSPLVTPWRDQFSSAAGERVEAAVNPLQEIGLVALVFDEVAR